MTENRPSSEPQPPLGEEIANSVSHGAGVLVAAVAGPLLVLIGLVWLLAVAGNLLTSVATTRRRWLPGVLYLALAWLVVVALRPLSRSVPHAGVMWLLGGGLSYTIGMAFFAARRVPYCHFVWHLFVLAGTTCHFVAVWRYVV